MDEGDEGDFDSDGDDGYALLEDNGDSENSQFQFKAELNGSVDGNTSEYDPGYESRGESDDPEAEKDEEEVVARDELVHIDVPRFAEALHAFRDDRERRAQLVFDNFLGLLAPMFGQSHVEYAKLLANGFAQIGSPDHVLVAAYRQRCRDFAPFAAMARQEPPPHPNLGDEAVGNLEDRERIDTYIFLRIVMMSCLLFLIN